MVLAMAMYASGNVNRWNMLVLYLEAACYTEDPEKDGPNFAEIARKTNVSADTTSRVCQGFKNALSQAMLDAELDKEILHNEKRDPSTASDADEDGE